MNSIAALAHHPAGTVAALTATIADVTPRTTAAGAPWAEVTVAEGPHTAHLIVPPARYPALHHHLEIGHTATFTGRVDTRRLLPALVVTHLHP
ncbi:hypothetical protein AB0395_21965 [Streptosporangium sp. NPDC051023]|uniref:hypothetical protein n=1 Tax=Streptosporangium sp. NPDC051023 TaxID=3155410 RepID=UPI00344DA759